MDRSGAGGVRRVVLVGYMGSGKTEVGRALARLLGWRHVDLDEEIERRTGRTPAGIIRAEGEPAFRRMEREATEAVAGSDHLVISTGGGWATQPGLLERLGPGTLSAWLRVGAAEALRRVGRDPDRPLLPSDPGAVDRMLAEREPGYRRADLVVDTDDLGVETVARQLAKRISPQYRTCAPPE